MEGIRQITRQLDVDREGKRDGGILREMGIKCLRSGVGRYREEGRATNKRGVGINRIFESRI
jgi:hypothetical protein